MVEAKRPAIIQCDMELLTKLSTRLQFATVGQNVYYSDTLKDLVDRHCPDIYDMAKDAGFKFIPSTNKEDLVSKPPDLRFDVIRVAE